MAMGQRSVCTALLVCYGCLVAAFFRNLWGNLLLAAIAIQLFHDGLPLSDVWLDIGVIGTEMLPLVKQLSKDQLLVEPHNDHITAVCKASSYMPLVELNEGRSIHLDAADPVSTRERLDAYVDACRHIYENLEGEQRVILDAYQPKVGPLETLLQLHGINSDADYRKLDLRRKEAAASMPDLAPRWKPLEELGDDAAAFGKEWHPVREEVIKAAEIGEAVLEGTVAVFDAREMFPAQLWNISIAEIADMHGDLAGDSTAIPIYRQLGPACKWGGHISLRSLADRHKLFGPRLWYFGNLPWPEEYKERRKREIFSSVEPRSESQLARALAVWFMGDQRLEAFMNDARARQTTQITVNVRRLPKLWQVQDFEKRLGNPEWLERTWSMLWTGAVGNWLHLDEPDNLLICVRGEMYVTVFMQEHTDILHGGRNMNSYFWDLTHDTNNREWLSKNKWVEKLPFIHLKLEPGQGVLVPSRTYHSIYSPQSDRILLNCFMMPKYGKLANTTASRKGGFWQHGSQRDPFFALYHLKASSLYRLWDTRRLGGFFEFTKFELL